MGASSSIIHREESHEEYHPDDIRSLLKNRKASDELFTAIAAKVSKEEGRINSMSSINVRNLVNYFKHEPNPMLSAFLPDKEVLVYAHRHVCEAMNEKKLAKSKSIKKKSKGRIDTSELMSENIFRDGFFLLISTIYLYSHIWKIFTIMDELEIPDKKITKHEFMQSRTHERMKELNFLTSLTDITEEEWEEAYNAMDVNGDGAISFEEACAFTMNTLLYIPKEFIAGEDGMGSVREATMKSNCNAGKIEYEFESISKAVAAAESDGRLSKLGEDVAISLKVNNGGAPVGTTDSVDDGAPVRTTDSVDDGATATVVCGTTTCGSSAAVDNISPNEAEIVTDLSGSLPIDRSVAQPLSPQPNQKVDSNKVNADENQNNPDSAASTE